MRPPTSSIVVLAVLTVTASCAPSTARRPAEVAAQPVPVPQPPSETRIGGGPFELTVANIMRGEELVGRSPDDLRWSADSRYVYFQWRDPESPDTTTFTYRASVETGTPEQLSDSVADRIAPASNGFWSRDRALRAVSRHGDIYVVEPSGAQRRITDTPVREHSPHLPGEGRTLYFAAENNVFALDLAGGPLRQITDIHAEEEPEEPEPEGQQAFLEEQQTDLFEAVRDRIREEEHQEAVDSVRNWPPPFYIGEESSVVFSEVSPSGRYLLFAVAEDADSEPTMVPNFVTESGYTEELMARPKVGDAWQGEKAAIMDLKSGKVTWIEPDPEDVDRTFIPVGWAPATDRALVIGVAASFEDRWIYRVDPDGTSTVVDHLHDDAWVGGPGLFTAGWLPGADDGAGEGVYFISERTGYAHLYTVDPDGDDRRSLTEGSWEVTNVQLSGDGQTFYLTTSETHPGERHLFAMSADGGERTRVTPWNDGWNAGLVSPDGRWVAVLRERANQPPDLFLMPNQPAAEARRVTRSTTEEWRRGPWIIPEILTIPASDGALVHSRIFRPEDVSAEPNGAAVIFVHGAGYLQNAHYGWSSYFREYMFHHLLASRGFTVLDMDYRGSAGYGRKWRTAIYRHMGGKDLSDQVDGARYLVEHEGIDPDRIGIYGGSYGGFITLMAMFTEPDVFRSGAALRSVTDWAHYNQWYTSRILNLPQDDPEAYRQSSPIYFAEGFEGDLLIAHGMVDTNVHFQDVVRLAQRLIELGKTGWEMAVYPVEGHAFERPESWTDEYRRILDLFERTLLTEAAPAG